MSKDKYGRTVVTHKGKGSKIDSMPSRHDKSVITGGDAFNRSQGQYGKSSLELQKQMAQPATVHPFN